MSIFTLLNHRRAISATAATARNQARIMKPRHPLTPALPIDPRPSTSQQEYHVGMKIQMM
jgi:hypothetical protein